MYKGDFRSWQFTSGCNLWRFLANIFIIRMLAI